MADVLLRSVTLPDGTRADVRLSGGRIATIDHSTDDPPAPPDGAGVHELDGWLVLPSPVEPHAHLDKAYTADLVANPSGDLLGAIEAWIARYPERTVEEIYGRARPAALDAAVHGCTAIRTHVDVNEILGTTAVEALNLVKADLSEVIDLQIIGLAGRPTSGPEGEGNRRALEAALGGGARRDRRRPPRRPRSGVGRRLQPRRGRPTPASPSTSTSTRTSTRRRRPRPPGPTRPRPRVPQPRHRQPLRGARRPPARPNSVRPPPGWRTPASRSSPSPRRNLFLQARGQRTAPPRGLTAVASLLEAGVNVAAGGDNLQDPFNTVGRADPLETASLMVVAAHRRRRHRLPPGLERRPPGARAPGDRSATRAIRPTSWPSGRANAPGGDRLGPGRSTGRSGPVG